jgi:RNA polymerase sigma-70 factor, ECF subfamily
MGWLVRIATNRCLLEFRRRKRFHQAVERMASDPSQRPSQESPPSEDLLTRSEELEMTRAVLAEFEPSLLEPLVLRYFCDLNATEIGEIMQLPSGTVRRRLREARTVLARRMAMKGVNP